MSTFEIKYNTANNVIKEAFILRFLRSLSKVHWTFFTYHGPSLSLRLNPRNGDFSGLGSQVHRTCSYATPLQSAEGREHRLNQSDEGREHRLNQSDEVSNHGIKIGMGRTQNEEKKAVECGYTLFYADAIEEPLALLHIWHYNPAEEEEGKNGFHLDSKEPDWSKLLSVFNLGIRCSRPQLRDFIMGEVRYNSLMKTVFATLTSIQRCSGPLTGCPQEAEELFVATERNAKLRYEGYKKLSEL